MHIKFSTNHSKKEEVEAQMKSLLGERELQEYKQFAFRNDMFKLTVGIMLGNSFNKVVYGFSDYIVMPIFIFFVSKTGEGWRKWNFSPMEGLTFEMGRMAGTLIDFLLISVLLYLVYVKVIERVLGDQDAKMDMKQCKWCMGSIRSDALKCPMCTGDLIVKPRRHRTKNKRTKDSRSK